MPETMRVEVDRLCTWIVVIADVNFMYELKLKDSIQSSLFVTLI